MNYLNAENLSKAFTEKVLFSDISISLQKNQKAALIAANGSGKSTILKIIAGRESPDSGTVSIRKSVTVGYLEQEPDLNPSSTVIDSIFDSSSPELKALGEYEQLIDMGDKADPGKIQELIDRIDSLGAWDHESRAREILSKLGIHNLDQTIGTLSGGQRKRVALAKLLVDDADLFLLDEPTNHLDQEMIEWLENYFKSLNKTVLLISHDRYFIDNVCDTILELSANKIHVYKGNYAWFLEKKDEREFREGREIDKAKNLLRKELDWMRRQPQARGTKQKARIDAFYDLEEKAGGKRPDEKMEITMQMSRMGSKILELENVCKSYNGKTLITDFSHTFKRGEKVGIVGANGTGKSTLLNMIMGLVKPDKGRIKTGETMVFGYFSQKGIELPEDKRVIEVVKDIAEYIDTGNGNYVNAARFLEYFKFDGSMQHTYVSRLSGGEKRRLYLITVLMNNPNFLILDEPTNDLDIVTLNLLENFLESYQGCMILVTHDRYFMDKLVDHVFVMGSPDGTIREIHGNYSRYREVIKSEQYAVKESKPKPAREPVKSNPNKLSYKEKKELESIEKDISKLENDKLDLENKMSDPAGISGDIQKLSDEYAVVLKEIEDKTIRWMELSEKDQSA